MVFLTRCLFHIKADELGKHLKRPFIDKLRIYVKSGDGGNGIMKLGGTGGDGGSIYIKAKSGISLKDVYMKNLRKRYIAPHGENSKKTKLYGENGEDLVIQVPCGVTAYVDTGVCIGEVDSVNEELVLIRGGKGGSALNKYTGQPGQKFMVNLDLKLIADVGLIGFPNAGKSTLLSIVSRARPKIASYPFTTINPQLGLIEYDDKRKISIADLPGLIEGAHYNRGMGHKFLKHITRTKVNMFMIDVNGFQLNAKSEPRSAFETLAILNKELETFDPDLVQRPSLLVLNKIDVEDAEKNVELFMEQYENYAKSVQQLDAEWMPKELIKFKNVISISAKTNQNVDKLCLNIRELIDEMHETGRGDKQQSSATSLAKTEETIVDDDDEDDAEDDSPRKQKLRLV